jgi:hypothetical protein
MRASVIVGIFVIALAGLTLRYNRVETRRHGAREAYARQHAESKPSKNKGAKGPAESPKSPAEPKPPMEPKPPEVGPPNDENRGPIHQDLKTLEKPSVIWSKEVRGEPRPSTQSARQNALEAAALALGNFLKERYPGFEWSPAEDFIVDQKIIVNEKQEEQHLTDKEAPIMFTQTLSLELRESQLKAAFQENHKLRVESRLWQAGRGLGGLLIILLAVIGYVRLDDWTKGYISLPLKLAAAAVAIAGPVILWLLV